LSVNFEPQHLFIEALIDTVWNWKEYNTYDWRHEL